MKDGAINPFRAVVFVDQTLVGVNNHHDGIIGRRGRIDEVSGGPGAAFLAVNLPSILTAKVGDHVIAPRFVPPVISHFLQDFLRGEELPHEDHGGPLDVGNVNRPEHVRIGR